MPAWSVLNQGVCGRWFDSSRRWAGVSPGKVWLIRASMAVVAPPGRHTFTVRWTGNPQTPVGFFAAVVAIVALLWRRSPDGPRWT